MSTTLKMLQSKFGTTLTKQTKNWVIKKMYFTARDDS